MEAGQKGKTKKEYQKIWDMTHCFVAQKKPSPGRMASGWYGRLREPISPLSLLSSDEL
jgi:hypothetical protein